MADVTVSHPTLPGVQRKVPAKNAARWVKAGWIREGSSSATSAPANTANAATSSSSSSGKSTTSSRKKATS